MKSPTRPIAIYHEHPDWFRPLFAELDHRGTPYVRIDARHHQYDVASKDGQYALFFNRMSPSAYLRGNRQGIFFTPHYLAHLEELGVRVINGLRAFTIETSKALQLSLLESLGLPYPRARVINHPSEAAAAAKCLRFPVVVKPNIGGSGAGVMRFDRPDELEQAAGEGRLNLGIDHTALVQEFIPARGGYITRVEVLGYKYLYAIQVFLSGEGFNLCPADICQTAGGVELRRAACPVDAPKTGLRVDGYRQPVFAGWPRNVEDENMEPSWRYASRLARRSEEIGFDLTLIAELNLNDIKRPEAPSLDAWSTAAALAAVTKRLELMVAVRPTFHNPALLAKQAANIDHISGGRVSLNVVSSW